MVNQYLHRLVKHPQIEVREFPLSYNFTGVISNVIPKAFTIPAIVNIKDS